MEDSNVEPNKWWELAKTQFKEKLQKNLATHKRTKEGYRKYLLAFKKAFLDFIYKSPNKAIQSIEEVGETKCSGIEKKK